MVHAAQTHIWGVHEHSTSTIIVTSALVGMLVWCARGMCHGAGPLHRFDDSLPSTLLSSHWKTSLTGCLRRVRSHADMSKTISTLQSHMI